MRIQADVAVAVLLALFPAAAPAQEQHRAPQYNRPEDIPPEQLKLLQRVVPQLDTKRWSIVYMDNAHVTSLDRQTVKKTARDTFRVWVRRDLAEPLQLSRAAVDHVLTQELVGCSGSRFRVLKSVSYSAWGESLLTIETPFEWQELVPASVGEMEYAEVCHDAREVAKRADQK
jgi:hypothetical protein